MQAPTDFEETVSSDAWLDWLGSPPGQYVLQWEQQQFDEAVVDLFGFFALQCSLSGLQALNANRMPTRISATLPGEPVAPVESGVSRLVIERFEELPFADQTLDLVVLPHVLEFATDPHQVLREVDRVLRPEGRVIVSGFNPLSLWGARQILLRPVLQAFLPRKGQFIAPPRLRDWFKLLSFEQEIGRYGCYRPPCRTQDWLDRTQFMESAGDRWWPICGAVYFLSAVKRVRAMRMVGPAWKQAPRHVPAVVVATPQFSDKGSRVSAEVD